MAQAKQGDTVRVHYTGKLDDGTVFDTSVDGDPLEFTIGQGQLIPGFEQAVVGMEPGQSRTTMISADEAYGPHDENMVVVVDKGQFPDNVTPEIDQELQIRQGDGRTFVVRVTDVSDAEVTLDANHPLAGEDLTFDIRLVDIV
jgi:peptidylprolyl isomerase